MTHENVMKRMPQIAGKKGSSFATFYWGWSPKKQVRQAEVEGDGI